MFVFVPYLALSLLLNAFHASSLNIFRTPDRYEIEAGFHSRSRVAAILEVSDSPVEVSLPFDSHRTGEETPRIFQQSQAAIFKDWRYKVPTKAPTRKPTSSPTKRKSPMPTIRRPANPTQSPFKPPSTSFPTIGPSFPSAGPVTPSVAPSLSPTAAVTNPPTPRPSMTSTLPTTAPTILPTVVPSMASSSPTRAPTLLPSRATAPTTAPTLPVTRAPSPSPSIPPTLSPTAPEVKWALTSTGSCDAKCAELNSYCFAPGPWPATAAAMSAILRELNITGPILYDYGNVNYGNAMPYLEGTYCFFSRIAGSCSEAWHPTRFCPCARRVPTAAPTPIPTALPTTAPSRPTFLPTSSPTDSVSKLALPPAVLGVQAYSTGPNLQVTSNSTAVHVLGTQLHSSWVFFDGTFQYPFVFQFDEQRSPLLSLNEVQAGWHFYASPARQKFATRLVFKPSMKVTTRVDFQGATAEQMILPPTLQYGFVEYTGAKSILSNWTNVSWTQNCTHVMMSVRGNLDPIHAMPTHLSYLIINGLSSNADVLNFIKATRWLSEGWVNENIGFVNASDLFILSRPHTDGLEISIAKKIFSPNVVTIDMFLTVFGVTDGNYLFAPSFTFSIDLVSCDNLATTSVAKPWVADGNPDDFEHAFSNVKALMTPAVSRKWSIVVEKYSSRVYLGDVLMTTLRSSVFVNESEPMGAAGLILQTPKGLSDSSHILSNFKFFGTTVNVSTSRAIALSQCSLPPAMNSNLPRWFTMLSFTSLPAARDVQLGTCPLYLTLEQLFQHSFNLDPLMIVWTGIAGGMNAAQDGIFVPDFGVSLSYVNSHEMSHWTQCVGGYCGYIAGNVWMWEGHASFYGQQIRNRMMYYPDFKYAISLRFQSNFVPFSPTDPPLSIVSSDNSDFGLHYYKGEMFLYTLAEVVGYDIMHSVISSNYGKSVTNTGFIASIEAASGRDLSSLLPGWLYSGPYNESLAPAAGPKNNFDSDGDGLANFQEIIRGLNATDPDSDRDGYSDYWELSRGFDPKSSASPVPGSVSTWAIDGIPSDFPYQSDLNFTFSPEIAGLFSDFKCKRLSSIDIACAVYYDQRGAAARSSSWSIITDFAAHAMSYVVISTSSPPFNYRLLFALPDTVGGIYYSYQGPTSPRQPLDVTGIPGTFGSLAQSRWGVEFTLTVPGTNLNMYFATKVGGCSLFLP